MDLRGRQKAAESFLLLGCPLVPDSHTLLKNYCVQILFIYFRFNYVHHLLNHVLHQARPVLPFTRYRYHGDPHTYNWGNIESVIFTERVREGPLWLWLQQFSLHIETAELLARRPH